MNYVLIPRDICSLLYSIEYSMPYTIAVYYSTYYTILYTIHSFQLIKGNIMINLIARTR